MQFSDLKPEHKEKILKMLKEKDLDTETFIEIFNNSILNQLDPNAIIESIKINIVELNIDMDKIEKDSELAEIIADYGYILDIIRNPKSKIKIELDVLEELLKYYIEQQDYEICVEIKKYINKKHKNENHKRQ